MNLPPPELERRLTAAGQGHLLAGWETLSATERDAFQRQLQRIDFDELKALFESRNAPGEALPTRERIQPIPVETDSQTCKELGEQALRNGEVAVLLVAGGQGSRLGFEKPKGMYPVGPVSGASLFRIHAEKVLALGRRYGRELPFLVMTSPATDAETRAYIEAEKFFGVNPARVHFFEQGTMPALDLQSGKLLLEKPGSLALSPNGHGGTLTALADQGFLDRLASEGVKRFFYFQVDNPLVKIADASFIGQHIAAKSEASSKVVFKKNASEKVGVLALIDGRCGIVEYSDMPPAMTEERDANGELAFRAGNPAIHLFELDFLRRVTTGRQRLKYHLARKKVPHSGDAAPKFENALKFELFIFDALPLAERWLAVETSRQEEFAPLKNASGNDSLQTCQALMQDQAKRWLSAAGVNVPDGIPVEISPVFALDAEELKRKLPKGFEVTGPLYLAESP